MADLGFWNFARRDPDHLALVDPDGREWTRGELLARCNQLVHGLRALGLKKGDCVATVLPNGAPMIELYLAATQAGWFLTPINHHLTAPEIGYIAGDSEAKACIVHERFAEACAGAARELTLPAEGRFAVGRVPGFRPFAELTAGQPTDASGRPRRRPGDELHLGHHRPPEGRAPAARADRPRHDGDADERIPRPLRQQGRGRQRPHLRLAALSHRGAGVRLVLHAPRTPGGADGPLVARGDAAADREVPRHHQPHGADPVPPPARAARGRPQALRRLLDAHHGARGGALPSRDQAQDARLVGRFDLRVLRRHRGRRHGGDARGVAQAARHRRARLGELRDPHPRRRREGLPAPAPRAPSTSSSARPTSSTRETRRRRRRTAAPDSSRSATSATSTTRSTCSCAIARTT